MVEIFVKNAEEQIKKALGCAMKIVNSNSKTEILNAEFHIGQFHAYLDMLKLVDFDKYIEVVEKSREASDIVLKAINKLYR